MRLLPSGALDTTFGAAGTGQSLIDLGTRYDYANDILVDASNQITVGGNSGVYLMTARPLANGAIDPSWHRRSNCGGGVQRIVVVGNASGSAVVGLAGYMS